MNDKAQQLEKLSNILRVFGGFFMIAGGVIGFDGGQLTTAVLGIADPMLQKTIGGAVFFAGIVDFFVLPAFFR